MTSLPFPSRLPAPGPAMTNHMRAGMILAVQTTPVADWPEMIGLAVVDHGASLILPPDPANPGRGDSWSTHMAELTLLGITGRGDDLESAVRDWTKAAHRSLDVERAA